MPLADDAFRVWDYDHDSGGGSIPDAAEPYIGLVSRFIREHAPRSVVDLGCGDFQVGSRIDCGGARMVGVDASATHIERHRQRFPGVEFVHADVRSFDDSPFDLALCKDVLQHWPTADVLEWLARPHARHLLLTNDVEGGTVNGDIPYLPAEGKQLRVAVRGLDLAAAPFFVRGEQLLAYGGKSVLLVSRG